MSFEFSEVANLPTKFGTFNVQSLREDEKEHLIIYKKPLFEPLLLRVHSECLTGDGLKSLKCDCGDQLNYSLKKIASSGGMVIYLRQEGRGIGLFNKINAYALQDSGFDTIQANHQLGFEADLRTYEAVSFILNKFNIKKINILTNNPKKIENLNGIEIVKRIPIIIESNKYNKNYLNIKRDAMGHKI